jgi:hypothetical protein
MNNKNNSGIKRREWMQTSLAVANGQMGHVLDFDEPIWAA